jgi:Flp pilus assembly protein TadG
MRNRANLTGKVRERKAAAAVELAVLLPLLMFLFAIAVDFARIFYYSQVVQNAARQGALYASDPKAPAANLYTSVQQAALADASDLSPQPSATSTTGKDKTGNSYVSVTVTWPFKTLTAFPGVTPKVTISHTVQMRAAP